jgi:hypothetical protein
MPPVEPVARSDKPRLKTLSPLLIPDPVICIWSLVGLVVMARGKTPDPIPNSAVKTLSANGTAS